MATASEQYLYSQNCDNIPGSRIPDRVTGCFQHGLDISMATNVEVERCSIMNGCEC
jgi:hypothetical protein